MSAPLTALRSLLSEKFSEDIKTHPFEVNLRTNEIRVTLVKDKKFLLLRIAKEDWPEYIQEFRNPALLDKPLEKSVRNTRGEAFTTTDLWLSERSWWFTMPNYLYPDKADVVMVPATEEELLRWSYVYGVFV